MDAQEQQSLYLEYLTTLQNIECEMASDPTAAPDEFAGLKATKAKLDKIKSHVFAPNAEGQGGLRSAPQRKKARAAVRTRIAALREKINAVKGQLEAHDG